MNQTMIDFDAAQKDNASSSFIKFMNQEQQIKDSHEKIIKQIVEHMDDIVSDFVSSQSNQDIDSLVDESDQ